MKDNPTPESEPLEATQSEKEILAGLRKNPIMAQQIATLLKEFEQEVSNGMNADEAEERLVVSLQQLGNTMMHQWAENTQRDALQQASEQHPGLIKHSKKNSSGKPR